MANDNELHPVRFTNKQVSTIKHIIGHFSDYFEEEAENLLDTVKKYESKEE